MPVGDELLKLMGKATAEDVKAMDDAIAAKERELDGLKAVRKMLALAVGIETPKKPGPAKGTPSRAPRADAPLPDGSGRTVGDERREKFARYLLREGATTGGVLCNRLDIPNSNITTLMQHPWFKSGPKGYELTDLGRKAAPGIAA